MRCNSFGDGKWVFVDWMGIEPGYGTAFRPDCTERQEKPFRGFCVPQGISLKVHTPYIDPTPIIVPDRPWENRGISPYATFMEDEGILRCWYEHSYDDGNGIGGGLAYAESDDGVTWRKPTLGLREFQGSTDNNMFDLAPHGHCVFKDPIAPPAERYKMVRCHWAGTERFIMGAVSPDGLHWTLLPDPLMRYQNADTQNIALYDPEIGRYVLYTRQADDQSARRGINRTESEDFSRFPPSEPVLESNPLEPPDWDLYCSGYSRWPGATSAHLMLLSLYQRTPDVINVHLATSRDGRTWHRPLGRSPWVGSVPSWPDPYRSVYACAGVIPTAPGEWSTYLGVHPCGHNEPPTPEQDARSRIVRAVVREDGFVSLSAEGHGTFWTVPFELTSDSIRVNVRTASSGFLRCKIMAAAVGDTAQGNREGRTVEGFAMEDCTVVSGNHLDVPLVWSGSSDVSRLRGQTIRLKFELYQADLYAIRFGARP